MDMYAVFESLNAKHKDIMKNVEEVVEGHLAWIDEYVKEATNTCQLEKWTVAERIPKTPLTRITRSQAGKSLTTAKSKNDDKKASRLQSSEKTVVHAEATTKPLCINTTKDSQLEASTLSFALHLSSDESLSSSSISANRSAEFKKPKNDKRLTRAKTRSAKFNIEEVLPTTEDNWSQNSSEFIQPISDERLRRKTRSTTLAAIEAGSSTSRTQEAPNFDTKTDVIVSTCIAVPNSAEQSEVELVAELNTEKIVRPVIKKSNRLSRKRALKETLPDSMLAAKCKAFVTLTDLNEVGSTEVPPNNSISQGSTSHKTPRRIGSTTEPFKNKTLIMTPSFSPKSPRQLFSPFSKTPMKDKTLAFEGLATIVRPNDTPLKKSMSQLLFKKATKFQVEKPVLTPVGSETVEEPQFNEEQETGLKPVMVKTPKKVSAERKSSRISLKLAKARNSFKVSKSSISPKPDAEDPTEWEELSDEDEQVKNRVGAKKSPLRSLTAGSKAVTKQKRNSVISKAKTAVTRVSGSLKRSSNNAPLKLYPGSEDRQLAKSRIAFFNALPGSSKPAGSSCGKLVQSYSRFGTPNQSDRSSKSRFPTPNQNEKSNIFLEEELKKRNEKENAVLLKRDLLMKQQIEEKKAKNEQKRLMAAAKRQQQIKEQQEKLRSVEQKVTEMNHKKKLSEDHKRRQAEKKRQEEIELRQKCLAMKQAKQQEECRLEALKLNAMMQPSIPKISQTSSMASISSYKTCKDVQVEQLPASIISDISTASTSKANPTLNVTFNANSTTDSTYDITPHHSELPPQPLKNPNDYDICDLKSDDDTDDDSAPKKRIPSWAEGFQLRRAIFKQITHPPDFERLFPPISTCQLEDIFILKRKRFVNRTSSAVWHSPPIKH